MSFDWFYLEDFEDSKLNVPGVGADSGEIQSFSDNSGWQNVDSVDFDDGALDGSGLNGHSWWSAKAVMWTFDKDSLGALPTHVGIVWTDGAPSSSVEFRAWDDQGNDLGCVEPLPKLGDGDCHGGTDEDRFFGVTSANGISKVRLANLGEPSIEMDHLQYGRAGSSPVPEPASCALLALAVGSVGAMVRKYKRT